MERPIPNASKAKADPEYLRGLLNRSGLSQAEVARAIGIDARTFRRYVLGEVRIPYLVEFAVECATRAAARPSLTKMEWVDLGAALTRAERDLNVCPPASHAYKRTTRWIHRIQKERRRRCGFG